MQKKTVKVRKIAAELEKDAVIYMEQEKLDAMYRKIFNRKNDIRSSGCDLITPK